MVPHQKHRLLVQSRGKVTYASGTVTAGFVDGGGGSTYAGYGHADFFGSNIGSISGATVTINGNTVTIKVLMRIFEYSSGNLGLFFSGAIGLPTIVLRIFGEDFLLVRDTDVTTYFCAVATNPFTTGNTYSWALLEP